MSEAKADSVPGLGFKDKEKALETLKNLEGRDPDYQKLAVKGLVGRAKRVLTLTKDKEKLENINTAMKIFDEWLKEYEKENKSKENRPYLPLSTVKLFDKITTANKSNKSNECKEFLKAYEKVKGEYKYLRTVESSNESKKTWDITRNEHLKVVMKQYDDENWPDLWKDDWVPTEIHEKMISWAFSPDAAKIKKNIDKIEEKLMKNKKRDATKRQKDTSDESSSDDDDDDEEEESPKKKSKR